LPLLRFFEESGAFDSRIQNNCGLLATQRIENNQPQERSVDCKGKSASDQSAAETKASLPEAHRAPGKSNRQVAALQREKPTGKPEIETVEQTAIFTRWEASDPAPTPKRHSFEWRLSHLALNLEF
jgi:hypothetical protein